MDFLKYKKPASRWMEALPLGNGHMGAMVYSQTDRETIDLTENTFFSGRRSGQDNQPGAAAAFYEMRKLCKAGKYKEAHETAERFIGRRNDYGTSLPVGKLVVEYENIGAVTNYERHLNMRDGVVKSRFIQERKAQVLGKDHGSHESVIENKSTDDRECVFRKTWISHARNVLVHEISSQKKQNLKISFLPYEGNGESTRNGAAIHFSCQALEKMHCDSLCGVNLWGNIQVVTDGDIQGSDMQGSDTQGSDIQGSDIQGSDIQDSDIQDNDNYSQMVVKNAKKTYVYMSMETDYSYAVPKKKLQIEEILEERMKKALSLPVEELYKIHLADAHELFDRVSLKLEKNQEICKGSTGSKHRNEKLELVVCEFLYGRYLLYSSVREDSTLPPHLQGIWNDNVACRIGWTCDMHLDINTQMNYWPSEVTNLGEINRPLFNWMEHVLIPAGRKTAVESYGIEGWVGEIVSNAWGFAAPYWASPIAPCPTGGVWILTHMWEHYCYSQDQEFLEKEAYPVIKEAVEFFTHYVFWDEESGCYLSGPSISPENTFETPDGKFQISNGCTYEILMIRELYQIYLQASARMKADERDSVLLEKVKEQYEKLLPYRVIKEGILAEWNHDYPAADLQHRHTSHLLGLFPFAQITSQNTPELIDAVKKTMENKLHPQENWEDTGWARSMMMLYEARLKNGNKAYEHIQKMLGNLLETNGFIFHPPTRGAASFDNVYELDGNTGLCTTIAEMLLQSHDNQIELLPALPDSWECGEVKGLIARGNISVSMIWENGRLCKASLTGQESGEILVSYGNLVQTVNLRKGIEKQLNFS